MIKKHSKSLNSPQKKSGYKILIVDDDDGILDAICLILEDEGYTVNSISNGNNIFHNVKTFQPDIILLDVLLSGIDGRDVCKQLKTDGTTKQIPVIMISAHPTAKATIKQYQANDFLAKPFEAVDLLKMIEKYLKS
jgi:DNA-binding response OmpR family regulator